MAIHPIDLQTMYSQIENVAKQAVHQQQGVQLSESMQKANEIRQNMEQANKVQQMNEQSKLANLNQDGQSSSSFYKSPDNKKKDEEIPVEKKKLTESYLGQHIDITR